MPVGIRVVSYDGVSFDLCETKRGLTKFCVFEANILEVTEAEDLLNAQCFI